jgi:hypothetical protein
MSYREVKMRHRMHLLALGAAVAAAACSDASAPAAPDALASPAAASNNLLVRREKFVVIGTSISMGWASDGVFAGSQVASWPEQLSLGQLNPISLPLIQSPGCRSPLIAPLAANRRLSGESAIGSSVCAPNVAGVTLPAQNVALASALTIDALLTTPAGTTLPWYARVLPAGMTQVTAALSQQATLISVELGGADILGGLSGLVVPGVTVVPFPAFAAAFDAVLNAIGPANAKGLILGLPTDGTNLPALRGAKEVWADAAEFAALGVDVSQDCQNSDNFINVAVQSLELVFTAAATSTRQVFSCADVPGTMDNVLTPTDIIALNGQLAQMAAFAQQEAAARGDAFFSLGVLYGRPDLKPKKYSVISQLISPIPYGPFISLDGVHPSALGNSIIALAAANALNQTYSSLSARTVGSMTPSLAEQVTGPTMPAMALEWARRAVMEHRGGHLPACLMPGGCLVSAERRAP